MSGSVLVSTFVGLLINQAKVRHGAAIENATPNSIEKPCNLMFISHYYALVGRAVTPKAHVKMLCEFSGFSYERRHVDSNTPNSNTVKLVRVWCPLSSVTKILAVGGNKRCKRTVKIKNRPNLKVLVYVSYTDSV